MAVKNRLCRDTYRVAMNNGDILSDQDVSNERECCKNCR